MLLFPLLPDMAPYLLAPVVHLLGPLFYLLGSTSSDHVFPLRMPEVRPTRSEVYLCTGVEVGPGTSYWVTGFSPSLVEDTVHHMAVVGCSRSGGERGSNPAQEGGDSQQPVELRGGGEAGP